MKNITLLFTLIILQSALLHAQELIKNVPGSISIVKKSAKQPILKLKDGSGIFLVYKEDAINVILAKNGKQTDFCDPMSNAQMAQVAEIDIDKDGKFEVVVASKSTAETIEVKIYKKAEFETLYKEWSEFGSVASVEFPGNGTVKLYDNSGNAGTFKFSAEGQITEVQ